MTVPRPEYPRPQFRRERWLCLNGPWQFEIDAGDSGLERGLVSRDLAGTIAVPFCPESTLSGVNHTDFMNAVWYRRAVRIPEEWAGMGVLLHFGAVDYDATVWVNGEEVGRHRGGFTPFTCELCGLAQVGQEVAIVVRARDAHKIPQALGKQSPEYHNHDCVYTRTTGIWQTVWLEPVGEAWLERPRITPDVAGQRFQVRVPVRGRVKGCRLVSRLLDGRGEVSRAECLLGQDFSPTLDLPVPAERCRLWEPADPFLYDLVFSLYDAEGNEIDHVDSYAGLRAVTIDGHAVCLNGKAIFQRLVLDQGYYPDGIMTAPSDEALVRDIELSMSAGFNGARLHQKVFEERFLYHADRLGYLVWGEFGDWGCARSGPRRDHQQPSASYITQWLEALERDYSHPAIIGWCPLNETWQKLTDRVTVLDDVTRGMYLATKAMDLTRPVLDASGYAHRIVGADIYDSHDYDQNPESFRARHASLAEGDPFTNIHEGKPMSVPYCGQPYFVSEFGGIWWNPACSQGRDSWGYGDPPRSEEDFYARFQGLCDALLDNPLMFGYCYTQLTDVYQEQNGIYDFDRKRKLDIERIRAIQARTAAIELTDGEGPDALVAVANGADHNGSGK